MFRSHIAVRNRSIRAWITYNGTQ